MSSTTPNLALTLYDSTTDQVVTFATFRAVWGGPATTSNFYKIDTAWGLLDGRIDVLEAYRGSIPVPASFISSNYYEATVAAITAYTTDMTIVLSVDTTTDGTVTLNINSLGTKSVMKVDSTGTAINLTGSDLVDGRRYLFTYDGTRWLWVSANSADQIQIVGTAGNVVTVGTTNNLLGTLTQSLMVSQTINAASDKTTIVDADKFGIVDSAASNVLKRVAWSDFKTTLINSLGVLIAALTGKTTPVGADSIVIADSEATNATKKVLLSNLYKALGTGTQDANTYLKGDGTYGRPTGLIEGYGGVLTIAAGVVTPTHTYHKIDTEGLAATDDLDTAIATNAVIGDRITLSSNNSSRDVTFKDSTGNLLEAGDFVALNNNFTISYIYNGANWTETSRSAN